MRPLVLSLTMLGLLSACSSASDAETSAGESDSATTGAGGATSATSAVASGVGGEGGEASSSSSGNGFWDWGIPCHVGATPGQCLPVDECLGDKAPVPGHCPGASGYQCCIDTGGVCDPNAAPQPNVGLSEDPGQSGCPEGMIQVDTFCVDQYEATLVYLANGLPFSPYINPGMSAVRAVSIAGAVPQGYITGDQASDACLASGKRLCTDAEWLRACQGPSQTTYPYGNASMPGVCNDARAVHPAVEYFGTTDDWIYSELDNACLNQLPDSLDPTGVNAGCVTAEGAFDMMGNLHEWTADPNGTFRGGFYVDTVKNGPGCLYATTAHATSHWDYSTGFRCCADM